MATTKLSEKFLTEFNNNEINNQYNIVSHDLQDCIDDTLDYTNFIEQVPYIYRKSQLSQSPLSTLSSSSSSPIITNSTLQLSPSTYTSCSTATTTTSTEYTELPDIFEISKKYDTPSTSTYLDANFLHENEIIQTG